MSKVPKLTDSENPHCNLQNCKIKILKKISYNMYKIQKGFIKLIEKCVMNHLADVEEHYWND
jgi:hypothetical protein